jgi:hypothetical protein
MYSDQPDGYQGNEDCGQMSAWYVMSSWGLYPLVPGEARYAVGPMLWDRASLRAEGLSTDIVRSGAGPLAAGYRIGDDSIQAKSYLDHADLVRGARVHIDHSSAPASLEPYENVKHGIAGTVLPAPQIKVPRRFEGETTAYVDGIPQKITQSKSLVAGDGIARHRSVAETTKKPHGWTARITSGTPNPQYNPGSASLVDGVLGDVDWRKGEWTGVQGEDLVIEVRPDRIRRVKRFDLEVGLLKDIKSWIALPAGGEVWIELADGTSRKVAEWNEPKALDEEPSYISRVTKGTSALTQSEQRIAAIRIVLRNPGILPSWHPGAGGETFIFADEISITTR